MAKTKTAPSSLMWWGLQERGQNSQGCKSRHAWEFASEIVVPHIPGRRGECWQLKMPASFMLTPLIPLTPTKVRQDHSDGSGVALVTFAAHFTDSKLHYWSFVH